MADRIGVWVCLVGYLAVMQMISMPTLTGDLMLRLLTDAGFVIGLVVLCDIACLPDWQDKGSWQAIGLIVAIALIAGWYAFSQHTWTTWLLLALFYVWLAWLDRTVATALVHSRVGRWIVRLVLAGAGGLLPVVIGQIESRFADEEFFVFVEGVALAGFCFLFLVGQGYLGRGRPATAKLTGQARLGKQLIGLGFVGVMIGITVWGVVAYQHSFYTPDAPGYLGVTPTSPFVCGRVAPDQDQPPGEDVFRQLLARVEANLRKGTPELGMLALGTQERHWAELFRGAILAEAQAGRFTGPANSVKSMQYEAALRAYYAPRVRAAFPDLFTDEEWGTLREWFAAINRRALTVEWVDWMYALAFSKLPEGPYENQENGAGLLAILEAEHLSPPDLAPRNQAYLERNRRGWAQRFHNTDDAFIYQSEWINNAYFQSLYWQSRGEGKPDSTNQGLAFKWMLLQALPDGAPLGYNHPGLFLSAGIAYLAAHLERDPQFIWWSMLALDWAEENDGAVYAQPGVEKIVPLQGVSPEAGSCLIYSNSGLPNQLGPLAPDKIVFRDGWTPNATYALLNLRFSGWHRYKATNSIVLLYQDGPVVVEKSSRKPFGWLPVGRSLFRDKRIPREDLNGLLIPSTGWARIIHTLTGMGSAWAQDPPPYARVESVDWLGSVDISRTVIDDWRGWAHARTVYFIHNGPIIVIDSARGSGRAALVWHLVGEGRRDGNGLWLRDASSPALMAMSPEAWRTASLLLTDTAIKNGSIGTLNWDVTLSVPGRLGLATVFMWDTWASTSYEIQELPGGQFVKLTGSDRNLILLQNDSGQLLQVGDLATDSRWLLFLQQNQSRQVCFDGGSRTWVSLEIKPVALRDAAGFDWREWEWDEGKLAVHHATSVAAMCLSVVE